MSLRALAESLDRKEILIPRLKKHLMWEHEEIKAGRLEERDIVIKDAVMTRKALKQRMEEYNHRRDLPGRYFHPSRLGVCMRQMWFGKMKAPVNEDKLGDNLLKEALIFDFGTLAHIAIQNLCERAGILLEREVQILSKKGMTIGHADGRLKISGRTYLLEIKTANSRQFAMIQDVKEDHKLQVHPYMRELDEEAAIVLYVDKDRANLKEFLVPFDQRYYDKQVKARIKKFFRSVDEKVIPEREGENPKLMPCTYCPFTRICFDTHELKRWMKNAKAAFPEKNATKEEESLYG